MENITITKEIGDNGINGTLEVIQEGDLYFVRIQTAFTYYSFYTNDRSEEHLKCLESLLDGWIKDDEGYFSLPNKRKPTPIYGERLRLPFKDPLYK